MAFIIYALPRSRTNWLSHFLTWGEWRCLHEAAGHLRAVSEIAELFTLNGGRIGTAETGAAQGWRLVRHYAPHVRSVVVRRPVEEVVPSMLRYGERHGLTYDVPALRRVMAYSARVLEQVSREPDVLTVDFADLVNEETCRRVFEFCLPYEFDRGHWLAWKDMNMQADLREAIVNFLNNRPAIDEFKSACKRDLRRLAKEGAFRAVR